jgi:nicotinate-nucleotide--dimethylbenzimidazole phosphoribosyltransferase
MAVFASAICPTTPTAPTARTAETAHADDACGLAQAIDAELAAKTKPPGSLGELERLAAQIARAQGCVKPRIAHAQVLVFAGDHGIVAEGVSAYSQAVTAQMVLNFLAGGAAICVLAKTLDAELTVIDAGVAAALPAHPRLLARKIAHGTANFAHAPAMTLAQCVDAVRAGAEIASGFAPQGAIALGEMGIGNTTSAAALMHALTAVSAEDCVGRGTGVDDAALRRKADVVAAAVARHGRDGTPLDMLARYGGFEIAMMCGAMLGAAARRQIVIVDGFIATAAAAVAAAIAPQLLDYCVFAHVSAEAPHRRWLQALGARPLLDLGLRLGEGSGAVLALPLLRAAAAVLSEMATFASAGVSGRSDVPPNESPHESAHEGMNEGTNQGADA